MEHHEVLEAEDVILRPLTVEDAPLLVKWFANPDVLHWLQLSEDPPELLTLEPVRERFEKMHANPATKIWRIDTKDGTPIGQIEMVNIHPQQKRAELHLLVGEDVRGRGLGTQAIKRLLKHAFEDMGLRKVYLTPDADNERAIRAFEKAGFVREGVLREHRLRHGQPNDMLIMSALASEFEG